MIDVTYFQILTAKIRGITVDKTKVDTFSCVSFDTVTGKYADLQSVVGCEIMVSAAHDFMGRVIKQIIQIKF